MTNEELANRIKNGERELIVILWENINRLVIKLAAKQYTLNEGKDGNEIEDYIQCGFLAMIEAIKYFDIDSGYKFLTFFDNCIKKEFALVGNYRTSKREPLNQSISLDEPLTEDSDFTLSDTLTDSRNDIQAIENEIWNEQLHNTLEKALKDLGTDEEQIIKLRYYEAKTEEEIAKLNNSTWQEIHNKEKEAFNKIRKKDYKYGLKQFLEINTNYYLHQGVKDFTSTKTSVVEKIVLKRERLEKAYNENRNEQTE